ncbi:MAG TPA: helix-turn-helix transcriptional regulator [Rhodospirillaceae bacterium]|nr:helix-turn-helix transcriptional regulator [Rhodospirillaceae bacterium]
MLTHSDIWAAIDRLARENGLTTSGLARRSGLDPTTFNRSKRMTRDGKARWPSTESISKVLDATGVGLGHFVSLVGVVDGRLYGRTLPLAKLPDLQTGAHFDPDGRPKGARWDAMVPPDMADPHAFAVEIVGDDLEPVYHDGDIVIASPAAKARRGDRILLRMRDDTVLLRRLLRQTARQIEVQVLTDGQAVNSVSADGVVLLARIIASVSAG